MRGDIEISEKIRVGRSDATFGYDFVFYREETQVGSHSKVYTLEDPQMVEYKPGKILKPFLNMQKETVQQLMDELWNLGFRPKEQQFTSEQIKAIDSHLQDMRAIVASKIGVELVK